MDAAQAGCGDGIDSLNGVLLPATASSRLNTLIDNEFTWKGYLPCDDIVGHDQPVNLFDYFGKPNKGKPVLMFDNKKWIPNKDGIKLLTLRLRATSTFHGSVLSPNGNGILMCRFGRTRKPPKGTPKGKKATKSKDTKDDLKGNDADSEDPEIDDPDKDTDDEECPDDDEEEEEEEDGPDKYEEVDGPDDDKEEDCPDKDEDDDEEDGPDECNSTGCPKSKFDRNGVKIGLRRHRIHNDRGLNRHQGNRELIRGTVTTLDTTGDRLCRVCLTLRVEKCENVHTHSMEEFIILSPSGECTHRFHPQPLPGDLPQRRSLLQSDVCQLIENGGKACIGSTAARKLLIEEKNCMVSKSTFRTVLECSPEFLTARGRGVTSTSAEDMLGWLRRESLSLTQKMWYKVLSFQGTPQAASSILKNPKGRPSKTVARSSVEDVAHQMVFHLEQDTVDDDITIDDKNTVIDDAITNGCLIAVHNVTPMCAEAVIPKDTAGALLLSPSTETEERLQIDQSLCSLINENSRRLQLITSSSLSSSRVMIGAVWMRDYEYRMFQRFPEVLFIDATHKTNNEGRPLLLVCGRDTEGKVFVVMRVFMPNETLSFYRWVFLDVFPSMLGVQHLKRVKLVLTDGDSQEFNALDESIFKYIQGALRGRCGHHLVEKSFDKHGPKQFDDQDKGKVLALRVRQWVRSWMNGSSCGTREQFELSKCLLISVLQNNRTVRRILGKTATDKMVHWIVQHVDCTEFNFVFYRKKLLRCFDEYCTNAVEGTNNATKHSKMSAKPSNSMRVSATAMSAHSEMKKRDRKHQLLVSATQTPLYIDWANTGHDIDCGRALRPLAMYALMAQLEQRTFYNVVVLNPHKFLVVRARTNSVFEEVETRIEISKGPPRFREVHQVDVLDHASYSKVLVCSCGLKQRYGLLCRHLLAIEPKYDLEDVDCRWRTTYALYAYEEGKDEITDLFRAITLSTHSGIRIKTATVFQHLKDSQDFPIKYAGNLSDDALPWTIAEVLQIYESPVPICWNYSPSEYPPEFQECFQGAATFTQESVAPYNNESYSDDEKQLTEPSSHQAREMYEASSLLQDRRTRDVPTLKAMLNQKWKEISIQLDVCKDAMQYQSVLDELCKMHDNVVGRQVNALPAKRKHALAGQAGGMISFQIPLDTQRKSTQQTYKRGRS